jgi:hypothetical protein
VSVNLVGRAKEHVVPTTRATREAHHCDVRIPLNAWQNGSLDDGFCYSTILCRRNDAIVGCAIVLAVDGYRPASWPRINLVSGAIGPVGHQRKCMARRG